MLQNATRAPPGSLSGSRSTIAEKSQRSRGNMGLVIGVSLLFAGMIGRCAAMIHLERRTDSGRRSPLLVQTFSHLIRPLSSVVRVRHIRGSPAREERLCFAPNR